MENFEFKSYIKGHYNVMVRRLEKGSDGIYTIKFSTKESKDYNTLTIFPGWTYCVRIYNALESAQNGSWVFPIPQYVTNKSAF